MDDWQVRENKPPSLQRYNIGMTSPTPARRATCPQCLRPRSTCICSLAVPLASAVEGLVLQHPDEVREAKGSARLLHLCLSGSLLVTGETFDTDALAALLHAGGRTPVL